MSQTAYLQQQKAIEHAAYTIEAQNTANVAGKKAKETMVKLMDCKNSK